MAKLAVIGSEEFVLGFQLAGIKEVIEADKSNIMNRIKEVISMKKIGIAVVDQKLTEGIDRHDRAEMESSVSPVFVELSTKTAQDNLRYLIKKSIGVDLLSK